MFFDTNFFFFKVIILYFGDDAVVIVVVVTAVVAFDTTLLLPVFVFCCKCRSKEELINKETKVGKKVKIKLLTKKQ